MDKNITITSLVVCGIVGFGFLFYLNQKIMSDLDVVEKSTPVVVQVREGASRKIKPGINDDYSGDTVAINTTAAEVKPESKRSMRSVIDDMGPEAIYETRNDDIILVQ